MPKFTMNDDGDVVLVPKKPRATVTVSMGAATIEALGWALDQAYADQESYLNVGDTTMDYGIEWPEHARQCAGYCRNIAAFGEAAGLFGEMDRWNRLAEQFGEATGDCRKCGAPNADNGEGFDGLCGNCADKAEEALICQFIWFGLVFIIFVRDGHRWDDVIGRMEYDHDVRLRKLWKSSLGTLAFLYVVGMFLIGGR